MCTDDLKVTQQMPVDQRWYHTVCNCSAAMSKMEPPVSADCHTVNLTLKMLLAATVHSISRLQLPE